VVDRPAVLDTFVHRQIINFSRFERVIQFIRADGAFVFITGLETVTPSTDALSVCLVRTSDHAALHHRLDDENGTWRLFVCHANLIANSGAFKSSRSPDQFTGVARPA
jgi:hypothetical protein